MIICLLIQMFFQVFFICLQTVIIECDDEITLYPESLKIHYPNLSLQLIYKIYGLGVTERISCEVNEVKNIYTKQNKAKRHRRSASNIKDTNSSEDHPVIAETPETIYLSPLIPEPPTQIPSENISDDLEPVKLNLSVPSVDEENGKRPPSGETDSRVVKSVPSKWKLRPADFTLETGISFKMLELSYSEPYNVTIEGGIKITCISNRTTPLTANSLISYKLVPIKHLNLTEEESHMERYFPYPEYIDLAPCPCDLTEDGCDFACCCDPDCHSKETEARNCSGQKTQSESRVLSEQKCSESSSIFLCVEFFNSPFIDSFFSVQTIIHTFRELSRRLALRLPQLNTLFPAPPSYRNYVKGKPMNILSGNRTKYWLLPSSSVSQECDTKSVVKFGDEFRSRCLSRINVDSCVGNSNFAISSFIVVTKPAVGPVFSSLTPTELHGTNAALTTVTINRIRDFPFHLGEAFRHHHLDVNVDEVTEDCLNVSNCRSSLNEENVCENVVVEAHYRVEWDGPKVSHVHVRIVLGDVPLPSESHKHTKENKRTRKSLKNTDDDTFNHSMTKHVPQIFSVTFQHTPSFERPEKKVCQASKDDKVLVPFWIQDSNGFCKEVSSVEMKKDESTTTSTCWLTVPPETSTSCHDFRQFLCNVQQPLFQVSNGTDNKILITRNESLCREPQINSTACDRHPTHINVEILYAEQAVRSVPSRIQVLGVNISYVAVSCLPCVGTLKDCENSVGFKNEGDVSPVLTCLPTDKVLLTLTVNAIEANVNARTASKRFWYRDHPWECPFLVCLNELFYPFSELNDTDELLSYPVLSVIVGIVVGVVAFVVGSSPY